MENHFLAQENKRIPGEKYIFDLDLYFFKMAQKCSLALQINKKD